MLINCNSCTVRGDACSDCVITHLIGSRPPAAVDREEETAWGVLADSGLVPPLRMTG